VNADCLKLTSYFGERQRTAGGFAADALLDLYGRHEVATSILLRGMEGFGARRQPRTDRSLTLSEDLPLIAIAVDSRTRIEALTGPTAQITGTGLVTVERARLLTGDITGSPVPDAAGQESKLTIYLGRQERVRGTPAFVAVCDLLHRRGIAGATVLLGVDGTAHGQRERAAFFSRNAATPMMIIAVGSGERIARVLPELGGLLRRPLLTLERVRICKRDGQLLRPPAELPGAGWADTRLPDKPGSDTGGPGTGGPGTGGPGTDGSAAGQTELPRWQKLMVYSSEAARHDGQPIHRAIVRGLRAAGISGATSQRGIWGYHGDHAPHGDRLLQLGRRVPVVTAVIDVPEHIATAFAVIDELTAEQGLVTSEVVPALQPGGGTSGELPAGGLEVLLQVGLDVGGRHRRLVALDHGAVGPDQELGEVPLDLVGAVGVRPDLGDGLVEAAVGRAEVTGRLGPQVLVKRVRVGAVDVDLGQHREGDVVGGLAEVLDLGVGARLLLPELIAGEADDLQAPVPVVAVERLQAFVLRRQPALAGHVHDEQHLALVLAERYLAAVRRGGGEVVHAGHVCSIAVVVKKNV
jgi:PII-like signaling protein